MYCMLICLLPEVCLWAVVSCLSKHEGLACKPPGMSVHAGLQQPMYATRTAGYPRMCLCLPSAPLLLHCQLPLQLLLAAQGVTLRGGQQRLQANHSSSTTHEKAP